MNPLAKKEGNSRHLRLGCPLRVDSTRHLAREVGCREACVRNHRVAYFRDDLQLNKPSQIQNYVIHLTTFCFRAAINLSTSSMEVLCSVE